MARRLLEAQLVNLWHLEPAATPDSCLHLKNISPVLLTMHLMLQRDAIPPTPDCHLHLLQQSCAAQGKI
eukprot:g3429.t1